MRHYDAENNRLAYLTGTALPDDWDERWSRSALEKLFNPGHKARLILETRNFMPSVSSVVEGGVGCVDMVLSLNFTSYRTIGFDSAQKPLYCALEVCLDLKIVDRDIRDDGALDGYWSRLFDGFKGLMDPVPILQLLLRGLYDSNHIVARILRRVADVSFRTFSGHMGYFIFRRSNVSSGTGAN